MHLGSQRPITFLGWIGFSIVVHFGLTCALLHPLPTKQAQCPLELGRSSIEASLKPRPKAISEPIASANVIDPSSSLTESIEPTVLIEADAQSKLSPEEPLPLEEKKNSISNEPLELKEEAQAQVLEPALTEHIVAEKASGELNSKPENGTQGDFIDASVVKNPAPKYPEAARTAGQEGSVEIKIDINSKGQVIEAAITKSSGYQVLDDRALETVAKQWRFLPATRGGITVASAITLLIHFRLQ